METLGVAGDCVRFSKWELKKKREGKEKWEDGKMGEAQPGEDRWNNRRMDVWARWRRERRKKKIWTGRACQFMWSVCMCDFSCMRAPDWVSLPLFAVRIKHTAPTHAHSQAYRGARLWGTLTRERMKRKKKKNCEHNGCRNDEHIQQLQLKASPQEWMWGQGQFIMRCGKLWTPRHAVDTSRELFCDWNWCPGEISHP